MKAILHRPSSLTAPGIVLAALLAAAALLAPTTALATRLADHAARNAGFAAASPLSTTTRLGYIGGAGPQRPGEGPDPASAWKLATLSVGSGLGQGPTSLPSLTWGTLAFGWRSSPADGAKVGRLVVASPGPPTPSPGLFSSLGASFSLDAALRLRSSTSGSGSLAPDAPCQPLSIACTHLDLGLGDELSGIVREGSAEVAFSSGPEGRITSRDGVQFFYDSSGRRLADDRFAYTWDWRGRLLAVDVNQGPHAGEQVRYAYDGLGRLALRTHLGPRPQGSSDDASRPFIGQEELVWEGSSLVAEVGRNHLSQIIWRRTYVSGPSGLDDAVEVKVELLDAASGSVTSERVLSILRDEQGSVVGLVEESQGSDPSHPPIGARYLYSPTGEAHLEAGPELLGVHFDEAVSSLAGQTQVLPDPVPPETEPANAPGVARIVFSLPVDPTSLGSGVALEKDGVEVDHAAWVIAPDPNRPEEVLILPLAGWQRRAAYRIGITTALADGFGRHLPVETSVTGTIPPQGSTGSPFEQSFTLAYDTALAASATLDGAFPAGQPLLFQGLWTDPVTGVAYARNRWYDPRNAAWLSEDPAGDTDSPNLYAFVAWQPQSGRDPMGLQSAETNVFRLRHYAERLAEKAAAVEAAVERTTARILDLGKALIHLEHYKDAGQSLADSRAPLSEKVMAGAVVAIASVDVAANFATGGGEGATVKGAVKGATEVGEVAVKKLAAATAEELLGATSRELLEAGGKELAETTTREGVEAGATKTAEAVAERLAKPPSLAEAVSAAAARLRANRLAGNAFRDELAELLTKQGFEVQREVFKRTPFGKRFIDIEVSRGGTVLGGIETKVGSSPYTASQRAKDMWLWLTGRYRVNVVRK